MRFQENPNTNADLIDLGGLQVHCFDISVGRPAPNATVRVMEGGGSQNVIAELVTNASGLTEAINLPAPPFEYSMMPDLPQPFSTYDVSVAQEGFSPVLIRGVQIFPGATALQNIQLQPEQVSEFTTINIPYPVLWGDFPPKIPEDMVKELPPATGLVVLPQPVVPEFVIVHAGVPNDVSAPNYYVPFKDYIKNVASSEIYSNWPENTLRANIHAIISVTLNRVFTEWYRNMGFNFTITNSTAYDQSFTFGRNIFQEISVLVDEIFTSYITKPDIQQPLFAQYCDGVELNCPGWLSQWGSRDLGAQGLSTIEILRFYYGFNTFLRQAERVEGIPRSFPGENFGLGATGSYVRTIQEQLNAISNNYPAIPKLRADGIFGPATENSVKKFQEVFSLPATGIVDFPTWYSISRIFVAVEGLAEL